MVSKSQIKFITSLRLKKYRDKNKMFFAEGPKVIQELCNAAWKPIAVYATESLGFLPDSQVTFIAENELKKISDLKTPNKALAVFPLPAYQDLRLNGITIALDDIRDPGNLGTIIRLCDWFGVENLICSTETVDCYNPKVIQATMGSISRVCVVYKDLEAFLSAQKEKMSVYGAFMEGDNVYKATLKENAILVIGNEANGISPAIEKLVTQKISIPQFGKLQKAESLNAATATAILLSEFKRFTET